MTPYNYYYSYLRAGLDRRQTHPPKSKSERAMADSYLERYFPKIEVFDNYEYDSSLPREEKAFAVWQKILSAKQSYQALFLIIGKLLRDVRDQELFKELDYANFTEFLQSEELGFSREKAYLCIRAYEYFIEHLELSPNIVGQMNISRINLMIPVLKKLEAESGRDAVIDQIEDYNSLRLPDFMREINQSKKSKKPVVYYSEETNTWMVNYYENTTTLRNLGVYEEETIVVGEEVDTSA